MKTKEQARAEMAKRAAVTVLCSEHAQKEARRDTIFASSNPVLAKLSPEDRAVVESALIHYADAGAVRTVDFLIQHGYLTIRF
jgi:hypothetical protein